MVALLLKPSIDARPLQFLLDSVLDDVQQFHIETTDHLIGLQLGLSVCDLHQEGETLEAVLELK